MRYPLFLLVAILLSALLSAGATRAAPSADIAPRSIADIVAILDQQKPDPDRRAKQIALAEAAEPTGADARMIGRFLVERAAARAVIGRQDQAVADFERAIPLIEQVGDDSFRARQSLTIAYRFQGRPVDALRNGLELAKMIEQSKRMMGRLFTVYRGIIQSSVNTGDFKQASQYAGYAENMYKEFAANPRNSTALTTSWMAEVQYSKGMVAEARGNAAQAEQLYTAALNGLRSTARVAMQDNSEAFDSSVRTLQDTLLGRIGETKMAQGRLSEAEVDIRQALLSSLKNAGKYNGATALLVNRLASLMLELGRLDDSETLYRAALDIQKEIGIDETADSYVATQRDIGDVLMLRRDWKAASAQFEQAAVKASNWGPRRGGRMLRHPGRILSLARVGAADKALPLAKEYLQFKSERVGDKHFESAVALGLVGIVQSQLGNHAEALNAFRAAMPIILSVSRQAETEDAGLATRDFYVQTVIEGFIVLLAKTQGTALAAGIDAGSESFRLADAARGRSVQRALAASAARAGARDPRLAELVRQEQDSQKRIGAGFGLLGSLLALPPEQRDEKAILALRTEVDKERAERARLREQIEKQFPEYVNLIDPRPPSVEEIRASLRPGEAFISFYLAAENSFVWAVPREGALAFAAVPRGAEDIGASVAKLRLALEPQAETLGDIPPFDLALAHQLYADLLKPIESGWKASKSLIVVSNGALGLLPLSLLPVEPANAPADSKAPLFTEYKSVAWLARSHAVTQLPSAAALKTLRGLGKGNPGRQPLIGFGDPFFNAEQAAEADEGAIRIASADPVQVRGAKLKRRNAPQVFGVDSAQLAQLPRLPDTAEELRSVAQAMKADISQSLFFGKAANEAAVKKADLTKYRVLAFATHGLVPGELDGLTQPALALSAPDVSGTDGDGLLTMDEILGLKLDADWVVLSACNTGSGAGAGAEAASGLGRAFFYAGTRALLLTNWSVHSASAKDLVTDLFRRQAENTGLSRAEALRQAMVSLLDGPGYQENGQSLFAYAHPIFWAPYSLMGDGG